MVLVIGFFILFNVKLIVIFVVNFVIGYFVVLLVSVDEWEIWGLILII